MQDQSTIERINAFNREVRLRGGKTILFAPTPEYEFSIEQCTPQWHRPITPDGCIKNIQSVRLETLKFFNLTSIKLDKDILVYDPLDAICGGQSCSLLDRKSKPLYADDDHLTDYANSQYIYPDFLSFLSENNLLAKAGGKQ